MSDDTRKLRVIVTIPDDAFTNYELTWRLEDLQDAGYDIAWWEEVRP